MKTIISSRASTILFNWLKSNAFCHHVVLPANICETVPAVYLKCGFTITWLDISTNFNVSDDELIALVKNGNYIVHYNYTYGFETGKEQTLFKKLKELNSNTIIVDDRCLCAPDVVPARDADLVLYSTGPKKIVDLSYGGYAFCDDKYAYQNHINHYSPEDLERFEKTIKASHKQIVPIDVDIVSSDWLEPFDGRYSEREYFRIIKNRLNEVIAHKKQINSIYSPLVQKMGDDYNLWRFNILVQNKKEVIDSLFQHDLYCSSHYMSLGNGYFFSGNTPISNYLYDHVVNLFNDFYITVDQARRAVTILLDVLKNEEWNKS